MRKLLAVAALVASCTGTITETSTTAPATITTSASSITVTGLGAPPPHGVDPASSCMRRAGFGDPAESEYLLPFPVGNAAEVMQSYCFAAGTHNDEISYDFLLPIGSGIVASRAGTVVDLYDGSPDDGTGQANYLIIEHKDGTAALYGHLQQNGIVVSLGDEVGAGEQIATSGFSGDAGVPHLHFTVYGDWPNILGNDLAVNFHNTEGPVDFLGGLLEGIRYEALPVDYRHDPWTPQRPGDYHAMYLDGIDLTESVLWGYDFAGADLTGATLANTNLEWASMSGAVLRQADLAGADLAHADLRGADLAGAGLRGADLSLADISGVNLAGADLSGAILAATNLTGTNLSGAVLDRASLIGVVWDETTTWPAGFSPPPIP